MLSSSLLRSKYDDPRPETLMSKYSSTSKKKNPLLQKTHLADDDLEDFLVRLSSPKYMPKKKKSTFDSIAFDQHYKSRMVTPKKSPKRRRGRKKAVKKGHGRKRTPAKKISPKRSRSKKSSRRRRSPRRKTPTSRHHRTHRLNAYAALENARKRYDIAKQRFLHNQLENIDPLSPAGPQIVSKKTLQEMSLSAIDKLVRNQEEKLHQILMSETHSTPRTFVSIHGTQSGQQTEHLAFRTISSPGTKQLLDTTNKFPDSTKGVIDEAKHSQRIQTLNDDSIRSVASSTKDALAITELSRVSSEKTGENRNLQIKQPYEPTQNRASPLESVDDEVKVVSPAIRAVSFPNTPNEINEIDYGTRSLSGNHSFVATNRMHDGNKMLMQDHSSKTVNSLFQTISENIDEMQKQLFTPTISTINPKPSIISNDKTAAEKLRYQANQIRDKTFHRRVEALRTRRIFDETCMANYRKRCNQITKNLQCTNKGLSMQEEKNRYVISVNGESLEQSSGRRENFDDNEYIHALFDFDQKKIFMGVE